MMFDRLDSLILRRFPKTGDGWTAFPIHDGTCLDTLNLLVNSGCVQRKARVRWTCNGQTRHGYALLSGDWRTAVKLHEGAALGLDPAEFKSTLVRATPMGASLRPRLFNADRLVAQFGAIEYIKNIHAVGSVRLFDDEALQHLANPHPFPIVEPRFHDAVSYNFDT